MALFDIFKVRKCKKLVTPLWQLLWDARPEKPAADDPDAGNNYLVFLGSLFYLTYIRSAASVGMTDETSRTFALDMMKKAKFDVDTIDGVVELFPASGEIEQPQAQEIDQYVSGLVNLALKGSVLPAIDTVRTDLESLQPDIKTEQTV